MTEGEVPKCPLHKKQNKACKFCKAYAAFQQEKQKQESEQKEAATMKLRGALSGNTRTVDETLRNPGAQAMKFFDANIKWYIEGSSVYKDLQEMSLKMVLGMIEGCSSCEVEVEVNTGPGMLSKVKQPSQFICCVYNLMMRSLTRQIYDSMMQSRCCYLRCAAFVYTRLVMHPEQYWELLSPSLMDTEFVLPFPEETLESVTMGVYVQDLLMNEKYCDLVLPRISMSLRKTFEKRLLLYAEFRSRYEQNHKIAQNVFAHGGVPVEICSPEGRWCAATTSGPSSNAERCVTVPVQLANGEQLDVSLGMIIRPNPNAGEDDLTQSRGSDVQELLDRFSEKSKVSAVAVGKDYCKPVTGGTWINSQRIVPITRGSKKGVREDEDSEDEAIREEYEREAKKRREIAREHDERIAEISKKYCPAPSITK